MKKTRKKKLTLKERLKTVKEFCSLLPKKALGKIDSDKLYDEEMKERYLKCFGIKKQRKKKNGS